MLLERQAASNSVWDGIPAGDAGMLPAWTQCRDEGDGANLLS